MLKKNHDDTDSFIVLKMVICTTHYTVSAQYMLYFALGQEDSTQYSVSLLSLMQIIYI